MIIISFLMSDISMQEMRVCRQTHSHDVIHATEGYHEKTVASDRKERITWRNAEEANYSITRLMYE